MNVVTTSTKKIEVQDGILYGINIYTDDKETLCLPREKNKIEDLISYLQRAIGNIETMVEQDKVTIQITDTFNTIGGADILSVSDGETIGSLSEIRVANLKEYCPETDVFLGNRSASGILVFNECANDKLKSKFDITIVIVNDEGASSKATLYDVYLVPPVEEIPLENGKVYKFVARKYKSMKEFEEDK